MSRVSFQPLHGTRQELLSFPFRRPEGHPRKMAVRHLWRKAVSPAGHDGPCGPGSAEVRVRLASTISLCRSGTLEVEYPSTAGLDARWSCSRRLLRYRPVRCRTRSPGTVRVAREYASHGARWACHRPRRHRDRSGITDAIRISRSCSSNLRAAGSAPRYPSARQFFRSEFGRDRNTISGDLRKCPD
jgi:hypothetical protein